MLATALGALEEANGNCSSPYAKLNEDGPVYGSNGGWIRRWGGFNNTSAAARCRQGAVLALLLERCRSA